MAKPELQLRVRATGDWERAAELLRTLKRGNRVWESVVGKEAKYAAKLVRENLNTRGKLTGTKWPRLKPLTWKRKKTKRILFESRQLAKAITTKKEGSSWFIGVVSTDKHKGTDISLRDLAAVHEYGTTIVQEWTAKQRAAFFALLRKYGGARRGSSRRKTSPSAQSPAVRDPRTGRFVKTKAIPKGRMVVVIKIPARPFIFPVLTRMYKGAQDSVERRILSQIKSALKLK